MDKRKIIIVAIISVVIISSIVTIIILRNKDNQENIENAEVVEINNNIEVSNNIDNNVTSNQEIKIDYSNSDLSIEENASLDSLIKSIDEYLKYIKTDITYSKIEITEEINDNWYKIKLDDKYEYAAFFFPKDQRFIQVISMEEFNTYYSGSIDPGTPKNTQLESIIGSAAPIDILDEDSMLNNNFWLLMLSKKINNSTKLNDIQDISIYYDESSKVVSFIITDINNLTSTIYNTYSSEENVSGENIVFTDLVVLKDGEDLIKNNMSLLKEFDKNSIIVECLNNNTIDIEYKSINEYINN